jgi:hypothetical protein
MAAALSYIHKREVTRNMRIYKSLSLRFGLATVSLFLAAGACSPNTSSNRRTPQDDLDAGPLTPAQLTINLTSQNFGSLSLGESTPAFTFLVTNAGQASTGAMSSSIGGAGAASFFIDGRGCDEPLRELQSCQIRVIFRPNSSGVKSATLLVTSQFGGTVMAALDGAGLLPGAISISPNFKDFGATMVGSESPDAVFDLRNNGQAATGTIQIDLVGDGSSQFVVTQSTCGAPMEPNTTCSIGVKFRPSEEGHKRASIEVTTTPGGKAVASLTGTGVALPPAGLVVTPTYRDFGTVVLGQETEEVAFTVMNAGQQPSGPVMISLVGAGSTQFVITLNTCGPMLGVGQSCSANVKFRPSIMGNQSVTLQFEATPGGRAAATLTGMAIAMPQGALLVLDSPFKDAGGVPVGSQGLAFFEVTNAGDQISGMANVQLFGLNATEFSILDNGCQLPLQPMGKCTITVGFTPTTPGDKTANIRISATPGGSVSGSLRARGLGDGELSASSLFLDLSSVTPNTGQTFEAPLSVTNVGGKMTGAIMASITQGDPDFALVPTVSDCRGQVLPAMATCNLRVRFSTTTLGEKFGTLSISATPGGTLTVTLSGRGVEQAQLPNGLNYSYYEGSWTTLPNFDVLTPVKTGIVDRFTLDPRNRSTNFGFVFSGWIQIDNPGTYTFYTSSDDGSQLFINGQRIVNNDGVHAMQERSGTVQLSAGRHAIRVNYFQGTGAFGLTVSYAGPGVSKQNIPNHVLFR